MKLLENQAKKTGTTTVTIKGKDCIVLAADMRMTAGYRIAAGDFEKIFLLNDYTAMTIAGTVSTVQMIEKYLTTQLKLREIQTGRKSTVKEIVNLVRNWLYSSIRHGGHFAGASAFMIAGYDAYGLHIYDLGYDGSLHTIGKFGSDGSGSSYALGVLETKYKENLSETEAINLGVDAIEAAIQRDIASGNGVNVVLINKDGAKSVLTKKVNTHFQ